MYPTLLQQFVTEECTASVCQLLEVALAKTSPSVEVFEFNRFDLELHRDEGYVLVDDILEAGDGGTQRVSMAEFLAALGPAPA